MNPVATLAIQEEEAVIGCALIDSACFPDCANIISSRDFHIHKHRWIWDALGALHDAGGSVDSLTLTDELQKRGHLEEIGGLAYLIRLINSVPTSLHSEAYARIVRAASLRRQLGEAASAIARLAADESADVAQVLLDADATLRAVTDGAPGAGEVSTQLTAVSEWYDEIQHFMNHGEIPGLTTGYPIIDKKTQGIRRGELLILAGRPSMGKTSLAAQMSIRQARAGLRVGVMTLEESRTTWVEAAALAELGYNKFGNALDMARIAEKSAELSHLPIAYYDKGYAPMQDIESQARFMARQLGGLDMIWLDHLGYVRHQTDSGSLPFAIGQTTKRLARLAKEYDCGVGALCQLSRESAKAGNEPQLTDLRDSGEIEQDARQVWMLHTPGYYAIDPPDDNKPQPSHLLVKKNSKGPTGKITLAWVKSMRRFAEVQK